MPAQEIQCKVVSSRYITPTVFELAFEATPRFAFQGGQFVSVVIPGAGPKGRDLRRAYSIASEPEKYPIELCVKLVEGGPGTTYLSKLQIGDTFRGFAPYGDFVYETPSTRRACFISTGTGIAPFRAMVFSEQYKKNPPLSALCLLGVREVNELMYSKEFLEVPNLKWVETVSRPTDSSWTGFKGRVTDYIRQLGPSFPWLETDFYLCGNGAMIEETKSILAAHGVQPAAIFQEVYYKPKPGET